MKSNHVILLLMLGAFLDAASRTYLQTNKPVDAIVAGVGAAGTTMVAGLAQSPVQQGLEALKGVAVKRLGGISADFPTEAPADPAHD